MRRWILAIGVFSLAINLLALTVPLHMMQVYDRVLTSRSGETLLFLTLLAAGLLVTLGILENVRSRILVRIGLRMDHELGDRVFEASARNRLRGRNDHPGQSLRDLETLRNFASGSALPVLFDAPWTPIFLVVISLIHPVLGLIALVGAAVLLALAIANESATARLSQVATGHAIASAGFADSALRNAEVIEAMGMSAGIINRWRQQQGLAVRNSARMADRSGGFIAAAKFWRPFLQITMLAAGAWLAVDHVITAGAMIASSIVMARALAPVEGAIGSWRSFRAARGAYRRLSETMARQGEAVERMPLPDPKGQLSAANLYVAVPGSVRPVIKGVSFSMRPGEVLGIIGPSASGKSTLARALVGVWPLVSGDIRIDGASLGDYQRSQLGRHIGYLPQDIELFDGSVADNIARFGPPDPQGVIAAARLAGLHETILRFPKAYDTPIGPGGEALSGGQRQRIALARAVHGSPSLIVLDEPNASLDAEGEEALHIAMLQLKARGAAVIVIAHRPNMISVVDRLMVLRDGAVDLLGPRAEVLAKVTRPVPAMREGRPVVASVGA